MSKKEKHIVQHNYLICGTRQLQVGSDAWFDWLAQHDTFRYHCKGLNFSARKETRESGDYWYAYKRIHGKLKKRYLGKNQDINAEHLLDIAKKLVSSSISNHQPYEIESLPGSQTNKFFLNRKIKPPVLPAQLISRREIMNRMDAQIVFITAPVGYGKTTLAGVWCHEQGIHSAWVTLDEYDNSLSRFWLLVSSALVQIGLSINLSLTVHDESLERLVVNVVNEIEFAVERIRNINHITLVLDNYHLITNDVVHQSVQLFIEKLPRCVQVIIAGHPPNRFRLGKLRTQSDVVEIRERDLIVNHDAGVQYLVDHLGDNPFSHGKLNQLVADLGGWIAGFQLTAMVLRSTELNEDMLPIGKHEYLQEFLVEDVLHQQPPDIQEFLIKTSFLGELNAHLCEAVTGNPHSEQILRNLWKHRLFITKIDDDQETYQYQKVFSQALQTQLFTQYESETSELLSIAAEWNIQNGYYAEAVDQYFAARQWNKAATAIETISLEILKKRGEDSALLRWFQMLPTKSLQNHTPLVLLYVILIKTSLSPNYVHNNLVRIRQDIETWDASEHERNLLIEFIDETDSNTPIDEDVSVFDAYIQNDEYKETIQLLIANLNFYRNFYKDEQLLHNLLERSYKQGNVFVFLMLSTTYIMNLIQGKRLKQSERYITDTLNDTLTSVGHLPELAGLLYTILSVILFEQGKWEEALKALDTSWLIDPNPTSSNHRVVRNLHASCIYRMQGKMDKAQEALQLVWRHVEYQEPSLIAIEYILGIEGELYLQQGNLEAVERILGKDNLRNNSIPLNTLRAKFLLLQGNYAELLRLIEASLAIESGVGFTTPFELELLQPLALYHLDQVYDAKKLLASRVREFAREGIIRPFLALGPGLLVLLRIVYWTENLSKQTKAYIETIFETFDETVFLSKWSEAEEAENITTNVTPREKEIVSEMARGLSNLEIAWNLNITESTVKTHINNIYRKLGVSNRVQAVQFARDNNLI